jgi:hypothetical protein
MDADGREFSMSYKNPQSHPADECGKRRKSLNFNILLVSIRVHSRFLD